MQGYQFNAITDHWRPYVYDIIPTDFTNTSFIANGLNMDVLKALQLKLNFTTHLSKGNGSWSNMIDSVNRKQFDFAATGFFVFCSTGSAQDFSEPDLPKWIMV